MTDGIDAAMQVVEAPELQAMIDRVGAQAELAELRSRHHPVLPLRQPGDRPILTSLTFAAYYAVNLSLVAHAGQGGAPRRTAVLRALRG